MFDATKQSTFLRGIVTVLNTPFTDDGRIDLRGLRANIQSALDAGVAGFLVPAKAAEVTTLTTLERDVLLATTVELAAGRALVIGGTEAPKREERLAHVARVLEVGCDGAMVTIPFDTEEQFEIELRSAAEIAADRFLMVQDWDASGYGLPVPLILRLFESVEPFRSLKVEVVPAGPKYTEVLKATGGRLHVAGGWAVTQMIEALDRGVHAIMPTAMHRIYVEIHRRYRAGLRAEAAALFERILPVLAFSNQNLDVSIQFFKRLLYAQGIYATPLTRNSAGELDKYQLRIADDLIKRVIALEKELRGN